MITINGGYMEGGGQIVRTAIALSVFTRKNVCIYNIRARRPKPGLKTQHIAAITAIEKLTESKTNGVSKGSREIEFFPGNKFNNFCTISIETAGSIGLVLQSIMIASLISKVDFKLRIVGGATFGKWAPSLYYIDRVMLATLKNFGYNAKIDIVRNGFYPRGGALSIFQYRKSNIERIKIKYAKNVKNAKGIVICSMGYKKIKFAERVKNECTKILLEHNIDLDMKCIYKRTVSNGYGILIFTNVGKSFVGTDAVGSIENAEDFALNVSQRFLEICMKRIPIDKYLADQLIPYMALHRGSEILAEEITNHLKTNVWVCEKFFNIKFTFEKLDNGYLIKCEKL